MGRKITIASILLGIVLLGITVYASNLQYTTTLIYFNVGVSRQISVTLLGKSAINTTAAGAPTSANIEFNSTGSEKSWLNCQVTGGGSVQSAGNPIFIVTNNGNANATINMTLNSTIGGTGNCIMRFRWENQTYSGSPSLDDIANTSTTRNVTVGNLTAGGPYSFNIFLYANFTNCLTTDATVRNFTIWADYY